MLRAEPPRSRGEGTRYTCQRGFTGRSIYCRQDSELRESSRTRWECGFEERPYIHASQRHHREGISPIRQAASAVSVRNKGPMLPKVHQPSATFGDTRHQKLEDFSKHAVKKCFTFCYERKESGELCVLRVSQQGPTRLVWGHNGTTIHCGQGNRIKLSASHQTEGIYLCYKEGTDVLLLAHVICLKEKEKGCRLQPVGKDELFLPPDLDCLSYACSDNDPVLCPECATRGTIFLNAGKVKVVSPVLGETVTVNASVCPHEINKFRFIWHRDNMNLHYENHLSYTFQALKPSFCMCVAVSPSSEKELYNSRVFRVYPTGSPPSMPLSDPTVRQEVTPRDDRQRVNIHPSASQLVATASSLSSQLNLDGFPSTTLPPLGLPEEGGHSIINHSNMVFSPVHPPHPAAVPAVGPAAVQLVHHPPLPVPDTVPPSRPSESFQVVEFLIDELVRSDVFKHPHFNLLTLAGSPTCCPCVSDIISREMKSLPYISEKRKVENVVRRISQDTTLDAIGIRRCVALMYRLICSLQDDEQNAYHQSLGTHLMQKAPFPPMLLSWSPGPSLSLPRGEYVTLSVIACNANRFNWLCNRSGVLTSCHSGSRYRFPVDPSTCGVYRCSVHNRHGCVQTPPTEILVSDEPTSYSSTEASYEMTYNVGLPHKPSTSLAECATPCGSVGHQEVAPVEDERHANDGRHEEMVVGNRQLPRTMTERVVSGTMSNNDCRRLMTQPTGLNQPDTHLYTPRRLPFGPPSPHAHSCAVRPPYSKRH